MAEKKLIEWKVDLEDPDQGVKTISIVDVPAMESNFLTLSKEKSAENFKIKPKLIKFADEQKNILAGLSLIPDKEILRYDKNGKEYYGYFSAETIETIRDKYHKEKMTSEVNVDHDDKDYIDAYLVESYILNSDKQVEDLKDKGIEEAQLGAWFTAFKIEDEETYEEALSGELNGFSVEVIVETAVEPVNNNNRKIKKFSMKKLIENLIAQIREYDKIKLVSAIVPDSGIEIAQDEDEWTVGSEVYIKSVDEEGEEVKEDVADGEYVLEDEVKIVVKDGVLEEVIQPAAEEEDEPAEEDADKKLETDEVVEDEVSAEDEIEVPNLKEVLSTLGIDFSNNGYHYIEVEVQDGEPTWAVLSSNTYKEIKFSLEEFKKLVDDKIALSKEVVQLKAKIKEPLITPELGEEVDKHDVYFTKENIEKYGMNFLEIAEKRNIPVN